MIVNQCPISKLELWCFINIEGSLTHDERWNQVVSHSTTNILLFQVPKSYHITYLKLKLCLPTLLTLLIPSRNPKIYAYPLLNSSIINAILNPSGQPNPRGPYFCASLLSSYSYSAPAPTTGSQFGCLLPKINKSPAYAFHCTPVLGHFLQLLRIRIKRSELKNTSSAITLCLASLILCS